MTIISLSSSSLSVVAVTVAVALPWVRCVHSTCSDTTNNHSLLPSVLPVHLPLPALSIVCRVASYLQRIMSTRSFTIALVASLLPLMLLLLIVIYDGVGRYNEMIIMA